MHFEETPLPGVVIVELDPIEDERGFFARTWCREAFEARGLSGDLAQVSISINHSAGTLRGMHHQAEPHAEVKLVRVTRGAVYDVAVDLRAGTPTYRRWTAVELTANNRRALYIPPGVAHGFQTLVDDAEVLYQISPAYVPDASRGVRWDDVAFGIDWPATEARILSARDAAYPDFTG